ncbi:hypothetical protein KIN20_018418 [Parelaphostrongylus tenuis]|uniref:Uncharacterized protein n=1 Tax=Parelaphostrongylus tenuis TaxID=148309 RepID=A0AAD5N477_PARTN|nr:hypothetical protein KIN20_018418 [Parelaphostrongylus tenuis]
MDVEATTAIRMFCALFVLVLSLSGMVLHSIIIAAFTKGWKDFCSSSFYLIIIQINGCSVYMLFTYVYVVFPLTLTGVQVCMPILFQLQRDSSLRYVDEAVICSVALSFFSYGDK